MKFILELNGARYHDIFSQQPGVVRMGCMYS